MTHGATVSQFEREFAERVGAKYAIACANGTVTLQAALVALGVHPGQRIATTPLTMAATSMAILNVGAVPVFRDVDAKTWLMRNDCYRQRIGVSLYGLHWDSGGASDIDDAAQTLRPHSQAAFTSYSFQRSKILNTGEGGMLVTNNEELAAIARSYLSLGYALSPTQSRINKDAIKAPDAVRHVRGGINGRMNDATAALGLEQMKQWEALKLERQRAAWQYRNAIDGCQWLTPQHVPDGTTHDYWAFTVACDTPKRARWLADALVNLGVERPYGAWRLTYQEPAFRHLAPDGTCPIAESLQPRLLQFATNNLASAERNALALRNAIACAWDA